MVDFSTDRLSDLAESIGITITSLSDGNCTVECSVDERHVNLAGVAHGGLHATMLDTAMSGALVSELSEGEWCATAQLDVSFLNAAYPGAHLVAAGRMVRRGSGIAHLEGEITAEDGTLVASAKGVWAVWASRPASQGGTD